MAFDVPSPLAVPSPCLPWGCSFTLTILDGIAISGDLASSLGCVDGSKFVRSILLCMRGGARWSLGSGWCLTAGQDGRDITSGLRHHEGPLPGLEASTSQTLSGGVGVQSMPRWMAGVSFVQVSGRLVI